MGKREIQDEAMIFTDWINRGLKNYRVFAEPGYIPLKRFKRLVTVLNGLHRGFLCPYSENFLTTVLNLIGSLGGFLLEEVIFTGIGGCFSII